jgi:hypothetical protein
MAGGRSTLRDIAAFTVDDEATLRANTPITGWTAYHGMTAIPESITGACHPSAVTTGRSSAALALLQPCRTASAPTRLQWPILSYWRGRDSVRRATLRDIATFTVDDVATLRAITPITG